MANDALILVINSGSSSIKFALFERDASGLRRSVSGAVEGIGAINSRYWAKDATGALLADGWLENTDHRSGFACALGLVGQALSGRTVVAVGHRMVHGGGMFFEPTLVNPEVFVQLEQLEGLAPRHLPHNLAGIFAVQNRYPETPQVACFDTSFHKDLPQIARLTGLPRRFNTKGLRRYGFHGLSYRFIMEDLRRREGEAAARGRIIVAHLGSGASMAAIHDGKCVDTTMGFSTLAGLPMGQRSGDIDPGLLLYLLLETDLTPTDLQKLLYEESGLLGISGLGANVTELLSQLEVPDVALAIDYFCYHARRHLAALTSTLGGLDRLIFTGGVGANSPEIRRRVCAGLDYLGIVLSRSRNQGRGKISDDTDNVLVEAIETDEESVIAKETARMAFAA